MHEDVALRVLMVSKACVVGMYQRKLEELARLPGMELTVVVPPSWRDGERALILERVYTSGYDLHVLPMAFNGHFHLHFYPGLGQLTQLLRPDIVHVDEEPYNLATFQAMWLARKHRAKALFFTWQNLSRRYPPPFSAFECYNLTHAACAIAGNEEAEQVLRSKGFVGPVYQLPQFGVDPDLYHPRKEMQGLRRMTTARQEAGFVIGYAGRLVEEKGIHLLLQAVAGLDGPWTLRLIGSGPYAAQLKGLSSQLGISDRVLFELWASSAEMPARLNELDVLVLPSLTRRNWKEQFGRVLIEAMACEVPVIGSSSGEIPHLIGDAGLVFPEGNVAALREALSKLMNDARLCTDLGHRGRKRVLERYTQQRVASQTYDIYRQVLGAG